MLLGRGPFAEEALAASSLSRGQGGMLSTSAPAGPERINSLGSTERPEINPQPERNQLLDAQNVKQNVISAMPQAASNAIRGARKQGLEISQQQYDAQTKANEYMANIIKQTDGGTALMTMGAIGADPAQQQRFMQLIGESQAQAAGNNPHTGFQSTNFYG